MILPERCGRCGEEVRFASVPGGTAWLHRPGSPGATDGHVAVLGRLAPPLALRAPEPEPAACDESDGCCTECGGRGTGCWDCRGTGHPHEQEEDLALRVLVRATEVAIATLPAKSPRDTASKLVGLGVTVHAYLARAARSERIINSIGLACSAESGAGVAALWLHDDGVKTPAWKFKNAYGWGNGYTRQLGAAQIVKYLT